MFEQPLNERMRTFMRLDFLYNQALYQSEIATSASARAAMSGLLDILSITTRSDMRSDALKELERHLSHLNEFQSRPGSGFRTAEDRHRQSRRACARIC